LRLETRDARPPRQVVTTTPRPVPLVRELVKDSGTVISRASTYANVANLSAAFIKTMRDKYEGTRLGRQEIAAEILDDVPGALWTRDMIDAARLEGNLPQMERIVVAIDPSGTNGDDGERADSVGIVVAGKGRDGLGYILADRTCDLSPAGWGRIAVDAYHEFKADRIVAERNYGGAMVEHVIRTVDARVPYKEVTASRGKVVRAEPVAALYEQKRVRHVRGLTELEDQMVNMASEGYLGSGSPDRLDAMVWAMTELMTGADRSGKMIKVAFG
jgi:phage terminase large subunit-like protein